MKVLVNKQQHGGFFIKQDAINKAFGEDAGFVPDDILRVNADLIAMKERCEDIEDDGWCDLVVVELPEPWTDWKVVTDCDGSEALYAVVDGKIVWCS